MDRQSKAVTGLALASTLAAVYTACAAAYFLWPNVTLGFFNAWFHGLDLALLVPAGGKAWTLGDFVYGLAGVMVTGFLAGAAHAAAHNAVARWFGFFGAHRRAAV